jgi:hypothetical protein
MSIALSGSNGGGGGFGGSGVTFPVSVTLPSCANSPFFLGNLNNVLNSLGRSTQTVSTNLSLLQQIQALIATDNNLDAEFLNEYGLLSLRDNDIYYPISWAIYDTAQVIIQHIQTNCANDIGAQDVIANLQRIN